MRKSILSYQTLRFEKKDHVAKITLDRPDEGNTVTLEFAQEFNEVANLCATDRTIRAVIITARGKMFCAGGDLGDFSSRGDSLGNYIGQATAPLHAAIACFHRMDAPVVTAVNGVAAGGGLGLAMTGDIIVAAASAKFAVAYTAAGLSPDASTTYMLPRLIGLRRAQELILTNRRITANEARTIGLITEVVADDELGTRAEELALGFAAGATKAYGITKRLLADSLSTSMDAQMDNEARGIVESASSHDGREGMDAFLNKRKPEFVGK